MLKRYLCLSWLAFLSLALFCAPCRGQETSPLASSPQPSPEFRELRQQLKTAEANVARLTQAAYTQDSLLKEVQEARDKVYHNYESEQTEQRLRVANYLKAQGKDAPLQFNRLRQLWSGIASTDLLNDPLYEKIYQDLLWNENSSARVVQGLRKNGVQVSDEEARDSVKVWTLAKESMASQRPALLHKVEEARKQTGFPEYVLAQAHADALANKQLPMMDSFITKHTPAELSQARKEEDRLRRRLTTIWPQWKQGTENGTGPIIP